MPDLNAEPVEASNVRTFVETKLQAFAHGEETVSEATASAEVAQCLGFRDQVYWRQRYVVGDQ